MIFSELDGHDEAEAGAEHSGSKHFWFHRTDSLDYAVVLEGEITLLVDEGEATMRAGDVAVQRATSHAWSNRTDTHGPGPFRADRNRAPHCSPDRRAAQGGFPALGERMITRRPCRRRRGDLAARTRTTARRPASDVSPPSWAGRASTSVRATTSSGNGRWMSRSSSGNSLPGLRESSSAGRQDPSAPTTPCRTRAGSRDAPSISPGTCCRATRESH